VTGAAGTMCWAVVAEALRRRYTRLNLGMVATVAGTVGTVHGVLRMTAVVLMPAARIEGTAAGAVTGSWVVVARMGPKVLHYSSSSSRCLDRRVHRRGSGGKRARQDEAFHT